tara:strand:- start:115 stop:318 length:204 start_codon:yes stop_codon:yes gene_type:complete
MCYINRKEETMSTNNKRKKVKVIGSNEPHTAYLVEDSTNKFIVTNEKGNVEIHYPKKDYKYIIVEEK